MLIGPRSKTFIIGLAAGTGAGYALKTYQTTHQPTALPSVVNDNAQNQQEADAYRRFTKYFPPRK